MERVLLRRRDRHAPPSTAARSRSRSRALATTTTGADRRRARRSWRSPRARRRAPARDRRPASAPPRARSGGACAQPSAAATTTTSARMAPMIMDVHTSGCEAMFTSGERAPRIPRSSRPAWCLYSRVPDAWGTAPRRSTMSRPIFRSLLGAVAASLLIAAAGACTRDNPSNPNQLGRWWHHRRRSYGHHGWQRIHRRPNGWRR